MKQYICICGKQFTSSQSYNAHLSNCEDYLGKEKWVKRQAQLLEMRQKSKEKSEQIKQDKNLQWIQEQHKCERCGKVMTEKIGKGRFCSQYCLHVRTRSEEVKKRISESVKNSTKFRDSLLIPRKTYVISGYYHGIFCSSTWELAYLIYMLDHNIKIERCKDFFDYEYDGQQHKYLPDFYLPDSNEYVEIKGRNQFYIKDVVDVKTESVKNHHCNIIYIDDDQIDLYINYVKKTYNTQELKTLYDGKVKKEYISKKHAPRTKGYKRLYKDNKITYVKPELIDTYLQNGWII